MFRYTEPSVDEKNPWRGVPRFVRQEGTALEREWVDDPNWSVQDWAAHNTEVVTPYGEKYAAGSPEAVSHVLEDFKRRTREQRIAEALSMKRKPVKGKWRISARLDAAERAAGAGHRAADVESKTEPELEFAEASTQVDKVSSRPKRQVEPEREPLLNSTTILTTLALVGGGLALGWFIQGRRRAAQAKLKSVAMPTAMPKPQLVPAGYSTIPAWAVT